MIPLLYSMTQNNRSDINCLLYAEITYFFYFFAKAINLSKCLAQSDTSLSYCRENAVLKLLVLKKSTFSFVKIVFKEA